MPSTKNNLESHDICKQMYYILQIAHFKSRLEQIKHLLGTLTLGGSLKVALIFHSIGTVGPQIIQKYIVLHTYLCQTALMEQAIFRSC